MLRAHFLGCLGTAEPRKATLNWEELGYHARDLNALEAPFLMEELKKAIFDMPREKAPGPDGFIGLFFRSCWDTISEDLLAAITQLSERGDGGASLLNSANIVLIPKKPDAEVVGDFRPISLIHSVSKLLSKMMASRIAPLLSDLVSASQSAFIKKRCIHDNFLHVQTSLRELYRDKTPSFFIKLDISKVFDSVNWAYLTELLGVLGFGPRWIRWVCLLLSTASSQILLNGKPGPSIRHARGLRQGDPLSPMLFILAIDPLHHILRRATETGTLQPLGDTPVRFHVSLYADDATVFVGPDKEDLKAITKILEVFGDATGLKTNLTKTEIYPIRCEENQIAEALTCFPARRGSFPCSYLGLPLHYARLKATNFQPLIDKIGARLAGWRGKHFTRAGRVILARSVLSSMVTYYLTISILPKWVLKRIDKIRRGFIWMKGAPTREPQVTLLSTGALFAGRPGWEGLGWRT